MDMKWQEALLGGLLIIGAIFMCAYYTQPVLPV